LTTTWFSPTKGSKDVTRSQSRTILSFLRTPGVLTSCHFLAGKRGARPKLQSRI